MYAKGQRVVKLAPHAEYAHSTKRPAPQPKFPRSNLADYGCANNVSKLLEMLPQSQRLRSRALATALQKRNKQQRANGLVILGRTRGDFSILVLRALKPFGNFLNSSNGCSVIEDQNLQNPRDKHLFQEDDGSRPETHKWK
ncbi:hypothetical protein PABG_12172 [Paracoccidioides brasiliensis Pb03]|nr:hypothetical protein PABG_12172 [Paracoccidioides brasiliensis Pb03]